MQFYKVIVGAPEQKSQSCESSRKSTVSRCHRACGSHENLDLERSLSPVDLCYDGHRSNRTGDGASDKKLGRVIIFHSFMMQGEELLYYYSNYF